MINLSKKLSILVNYTRVSYKVRAIKRWLGASRRRKILATTLAILITLTSLQLLLFYRGAQAGWSPTHGEWAKRKQLTITNDSSDSLASGTAVAVTVNTKELYDANKLQEDCDDLRVIHSTGASTHTEIDRHLEFPSGTTCATSEATKVYLQLQAALGSGSSSTDYFMYYGNKKAVPTVATFDTSSQTFTTSMSKRSAPGPFATAPLVQGEPNDVDSSTDDILNFDAGTIISGQFKEQFDRDQGSVVVWWTPEYSSADLSGNGDHQIFFAPRINLRYEYDNDQFAFQGGSVAYVNVSQSITAGTTYSLVLRWDSRNTLDGTNYASLSIDDSHTYGITSPSVVGVTTVDVGNSGGNNLANSGIVEGLTIYRRPLYDGTNGIDVGNGDEINLIYNSGSGEDPTLTTGSWDVVFALPTDQSVGQLSTGTGEAWSHPHSSNLMYDTSTDTGGFMLNGTYTTDSWSDEGTPSTVAALAASEKIFAGGYKTTSDAVDEGIYYSETVTAGDDWVIRALAHSDATCVPKVILYDQTGTAEIGSLTGTTGSTRTAPDLFIFAGEAPTSSTELRVKLINTAASGTCYWHQVELLSNIVDGPSMESGSGDPWIPDGWINDSLDTGDSEQELTIVHSGSSAIQINTGASAEGIRTSNLSTTVGEFLGTGAWGYGDGSSGELRWRSYSTNTLIGQDDTTTFSSTTTAAWTHLPIVLRSKDTNNTFWRVFSSFTITAAIYADDAYAYSLDDVTLTVTPATSANSDESSGIRVDGRDTLTQTLGGLTVPKGTIKFKYTPRHDAADQLKFLESTDVYIGEFYGDADDYIRLYWNAANTVTLAYSMGGTTGSTTWDATSAIVADSTYELRIEYTGGGNMEFFVDGANQITLSSIPTEFGTIPSTAYWGSRQNGDRQADATFSAPTTTGEVTDDVFDIGTKDALLVCPFDETTTCVAGETPSTETGAIRYSGSKSALSFDTGGDDGNAGVVSSVSNLPLGDFTVEWWQYWFPDPDYSNGGPISYRGNGDIGWRPELWNADNNVTFQVYYDTTPAKYEVSNDTIPDNEWVHVAIVFYGGTRTTDIFINGTEPTYIEETPGVGTYITEANMELKLSSPRFCGSCRYNGYLDEARISNTARYSQNFTPQTSPFVRDEHTQVLYHFDENGDDPRNTGKTLDDSGNGGHATLNGSVNYVAGLVGNDTTTDTGKFNTQSYASHEGIFIEEATTNKITNPSFDHGTYNTNWDAEGANLTVSAETGRPYYKFGSKSAKIVAAGTADNDLTIGINPGNTNTHTLSAFVYNGTSGNVGETVDNTVAELVWEGIAQPTATYTDMGGGWWRIDYSAATTNSTNEYGLFIEDTKTVYLDGVQLEELDHQTSYTDGTLGSGYSWGGTAHDSTSSRTVENLKYATSGNIVGSTGTVSMWVKFDEVGERQRLFHITGGSSTFIVIYSNDGNDFQYFWGSSGNAHSTAHTADKWYHIVLTQDGSGPDLYVNGTVDAGTSGTAFTGIPSNMGIGATDDGTPIQHINGTIADLRIYDDDLTAAEVTDLYQAGLVSRQEGIEVDRFDDDKGQNPVGVWHFDESSGTTASDSSTYGNHLTVSGASWETQGVGGRSQLERNLSFDGTDDFVSRSWDRDFNFGTGSFSISGWFRHPSSITGTDTILARYGDAGYKVYVDSSGYVCFGIDDDDTSFPEDSACTTTSYADSNWYHFEAVKNGTTDIKLYIDGNEVASDTSISATGSLNDSATLYLGIDSDGTSNPWDGFLDEVVIYPYARDASQIKEDVLGSQTSQVYGASTDDFLTEGLVGYWPMDESSWTNDCSTDTVLDSSGNGNDGDSCPNTTGPTGGNAGYFGNAGTLDQVDDYIITPLTPNFSETTWSAWVYPSGDGTVLSADGCNWQRNVKISGSNWQVYVGNNAGNTWNPVARDSNTWQHIAVVYASDNVYFYKNGVRYEYGQPASSTGAFDFLAIGRNQCTDSELFNGTIDEARVYNRALSPSEISALYNWAPGPVGYWNFDEGSGTSANDTSGNDNIGTLQTGIAADDWVSGKYGKALEYDGNSNDGVTVANDSTLQISTEITLETWIYPATTNDDTILIKGNAGSEDYILIIDSNNIEFRYYDDGSSQHVFESTSNPFTSLNTWYHVGLTYTYGTGSSAQLYINGQAIAATWTTGDGDSGLTPNSDTLFFGMRNGGFGNFNGKIDEIRIYNYTRTPSQIIEDMNAGHPVGGSPIPSQVGYWRFDEGYGDTANDSGSGGNNGDLAPGTTCPQSGDSACPTWTNAGKFNKALEFDTAGATNDYVEDDTQLVSAYPFTMTAWVNTTLSVRGIVFGLVDASAANTYYEFYVDNDGTVAVNAANAGSAAKISSTTTVNDGNWHYMAAVFASATDRRLYVNGLQEATDATSITYSSLIDRWTIGRRGSSSPGTHFDGFIDEVKFYSATLTSDQISLDMNQGKAAVFGATSTDSSGAGTFDATNAYCPPRSSGTCTAPVGEWKFDEKTGTTANDTSGNDNTGTLTLGPVWKHAGECQKGACLDFDGSNDYITAPNDTNLEITGDITISAWVYRDTTSTVDNIIDFGGPTDAEANNHLYQFWIGTDNILRLEWEHGAGLNDVVTASTAVSNPSGSWVNYQVTRDVTANEVSFYEDGTQVGTTQSYTNDPTGGTDSLLQIASESSPPADTFDGRIDDVKIYNYERTTAQIAWDYNRGGPVGYWALDECSGTVANDSSENANNGTITIGGSGSNTSAGTCGGSSSEAWFNGATGKRNASLDFDGNDDIINLGSPTILDDLPNNDFSVMGWIYSTDTTDFQDIKIMNKKSAATDGWFIEIKNGSLSPQMWRIETEIQFDSTDAYYTTVRDGPTNSWAHIAMVFDSSDNSIRMWIDGKEPEYVTTTDGSGTYQTDVSNNLIIAENHINTEEFTGQLDEIKIFNYILTQQQIRDNYNAGAAVRYGPETGSP